MRVELLTLGRLCFCLADVYMLYHFLGTMFVKRLKRPQSTILFVVTSLIIFIENAFGDTVLNLLFLPAIYILFSCMDFCISLSNGIVYALLFYIVFAAGREAAFEILYRMISVVSPYDIAPWFTPYGALYLVVEYILAFLFLLFIEHFTSRLKVSRNDRFCWYLLIMPVVSLMVLIGYIYMEFPETGIAAAMMSSGAFLLYFSNAIVFIILGKYTEAMERVKEMQLFALKMDMEKTHYERIDKANQVYRKHLHDMHHYFNQFRNLAIRGDVERIIKIVEEVEGKLKADERGIIYCGDAIINVLLAEYHQRAKENGIDMKVFLEDGLYFSQISDGDKISMFGNLLANALEAAGQCREQERRISVNMYMGNTYFLIARIENTYVSKIHNEGGHFLTTKKNKDDHGLGIKIVKELAERYGGTLELRSEEGFFTATLMISSYQEAEK